MSMKKSGRLCRAGTSPAPISVAGEPVAASTTSTSASFAGTSSRTSGVVSGANLAEDLTLSRHERVEPRRDAEEVHGRRLVVHPIGDRAKRLAGELLQRGERGQLVLARDVDLGAVAGRETDSIA